MSGQDDVRRVVRGPDKESSRNCLGGCWDVPISGCGVTRCRSGRGTEGSTRKIGRLLRGALGHSGVVFFCLLSLESRVVCRANALGPRLANHTQGPPPGVQQLLTATRTRDEISTSATSRLRASARCRAISTRPAAPRHPLRRWPRLLPALRRCELPWGAVGPARRRSPPGRLIGLAPNPNNARPGTQHRQKIQRRQRRSFLATFSPSIQALCVPAPSALPP